MVNEADKTTPGEPPAALVTAVRVLLRPLIRLLIAHGITLPAFTSLAKSTYVDVAEKEFRVPGKPQSDSRINLLTGVHRKDVRRLRRASPSEAEVPRSVALGAQLVSAWLAESGYQDEDGQPRALPFRDGDPDTPDFEQLVASVARQDLRPRVVLDELQRLGVATVDENETVRLNQDAFIPRKGFDEKSYYFGRNLHDHMAAGVHNLLDESSPLLERSVSYHRLAESSIDELSALADQQGMQLLKLVNRKAMKMKQRDKQAPGEKKRMSFGIYFYTEDDDSGGDSQ